MWQFNNKEFNTDTLNETLKTLKVIGFVYVIHNITNNKKYIGKKLFNKNWERYTGSSKELNADIKRGDEIEKCIISLHLSKGSLSYEEIRQQIMNEVLFKEDYYNRFIGCKIHANHLKTIV